MTRTLPCFPPLFFTRPVISRRFFSSVLLWKLKSATLRILFVVLIPDRLNLFDVKLVEQIQERLKDAMKLQLGRHHTNDAYLHQNLLGKLPELRMLNNKHCERLQWYRLQYQYLTNMPPLFAEIFDIPKSDEEVKSYF